MAAENVNVLVEDAGRFSDVVRRMEEAGLKVEHQLEEVGVVTGSIDSTKLSDLNEVEGVGAVERSQEVQLPPPHSDIQ